MATESGFNPVPVLVHLVAIAVGLFLGVWAMDAIVPDLPPPAVEPGVESSVAPGAVVGDDPDSLFMAENLAPALEQLSEQLPAGEGLVRLRIEPGRLDSESRAGDGLFEPADVPASSPVSIELAIQRLRDRVTLDDVAHMELVATAEGPQWYIQLDTARTDISPPWTFTAPLGGPVSAGGEPPEPVRP